MKKLILITCILLAACVPVSAPGYDNPYALKEYGQSLQEAADAQIAATQQAQQLEQQRRSMEAQSTQQAWSLQVTQTAYAQTVQQTMDAGNAQLTQVSLQTTKDAGIALQTQVAKVTEAESTAQVVQATSDAIALEVKYNQEVMSKKTFWVGAREASVTLFIITMLVLAGIGLYKFARKYIPLITDWIIDWVDRQNTFYETRSGTAAFILDENGRLTPLLLTDIHHFRSRPMLDTGSNVKTVTLSSNKVTAISPVVKQSSWSPAIQVAAIELLKLCDPNSDQIIPANKSGISMDNWMQITDSMVNAKLIVKDPGQKTTVIDGTCKDVLYALEMKEVVLSPAPSRYTPVGNSNAEKQVETQEMPQEMANQSVQIP